MRIAARHRNVALRLLLGWRGVAGRDRGVGSAFSLPASPVLLAKQLCVLTSLALAEFYSDKVLEFEQILVS